MADHGMAILTQREGMRVSSDIISDSAPLNHLVRRMIESGAGITMLRDPTRGGLATILNEIASNSKMSIRIHDDAIPVKKEVVAVCELFGIDPLYVANEGKLVAVVREKDAEALLEVMRNDELGQDAAIIGEVLPLGITGVFMKTRIEGEQLPRIC
ncbi:MAG: hypothetical protein KKD44_03915 [Proteobacteria bacterium]|nr:hypothetical protein [Pseudomonadota bacterium]